MTGQDRSGPDQRRAQRALERLSRRIEAQPENVRAYNELAEALRANGDLDAAYATLRQACTRVPQTAEAWFNLGCNLDRDAHSAQARDAFTQALQVQPDFADARLALADVLVDLGELELAAAEYRATFRQVPEFGAAWADFANIKTARFSEDEIAQMQQLQRQARLDARPRAALEFALASAYEAAQRYADAFAAYQQANTDMRATREPWNAAAFAAHVEQVLTAFSRAPAQNAQSDQGHEVIFIVSLPRSGSTLVEQILASHSQVSGAGELPDLMQVVREESMRQQTPFPYWIGRATPADWQRLGERYLELTSRWREQRPRHTDKQPFNWLLLGAARAMLPGARFIDCRRDPLEACWSCFKQMFPEGPTFSYRLEDIAAFHHDYVRAMTVWAAGIPQLLRQQSYEALLADAGQQTRQLLDFCGLEFEQACLDFHEARRPVHTASAGQVRQPLRRDTAVAERYGALLDPLRVALDVRRMA